MENEEIKLSDRLLNGYGIFLNKWLYDTRLKESFSLICAISSLSAKTGYCYASNEYLAKLFGTNKDTISRRVKKLEKLGYIKIEYTKRGCQIVSRKIRMILDEATLERDETSSRNASSQVPSNVSKRVDINTSSINTSNIYMCTECTDTKNNPSTPEKEEVKNTPSTTSKEPVTSSQLKKRAKKEFVKPTVEELQKYIDENSLKVDAVYFYKHYEIRSWTLGNGKKMQNWKQTLRTWDLNSERYGTGSKKTYGAGIHTISNQDNFDGEVNF